MVSTEELRLALAAVIGESCDIDAEGAIAQTSRLLGFGRTADPVRNRLEPIIAGMLTRGALEERSGTLLVSRGQA